MDGSTQKFDPIAVLDSLDISAINRRLNELEAERKALSTLRRSLRARERELSKQAEGAE